MLGKHVGTGLVIAAASGDFRPCAVCQKDGLTGCGAASVRHGRCSGGQFPPDSDPAANERLVRPRGDAQFGYLPVPGGLQATFTETKCCACTFGQQISPPSCGLCQLGNRRDFLVGCELPALGVACCCSSDLRVTYPIRIVASHIERIEHKFDL